MFSFLTSPVLGTKVYLQQPTNFESFLRRIIICWLIQDKIDISLLIPSNFHSQNQEHVLQRVEQSVSVLKKSPTKEISLPTEPQSKSVGEHV